MLNGLVPDEYKNYNLINIILPKAYDYHTSFDNIFYGYNHKKYLIKKLLRIESVASYFSFKIISNKKSKFVKAIANNKKELSLSTTNSNKLTFNNYFDNSYNLFSASTQTYLRVLALHINQSDYNNNGFMVGWSGGIDVAEYAFGSFSVSYQWRFKNTSNFFSLGVSSWAYKQDDYYCGYYDCYWTEETYQAFMPIISLDRRF